MSYSDEIRLLSIAIYSIPILLLLVLFSLGGIRNAIDRLDRRG